VNATNLRLGALLSLGLLLAGCSSSGDSSGGVAPAASVETTTATVSVTPPAEQSALDQYNSAPLAGSGANGLANAPTDPQQGVDAEAQFTTFIFQEVVDFWQNTEGVSLDPTVTFQPVTSDSPIVSCVSSDKQTVGTGDIAEIGPFYCQDDGNGNKVIYWPLGDAFTGLRGGTLANYGAFAEADAIAHEFGHYIQDLNGIIDVEQQNADAAQNAGDGILAAAWTQGVELQADCLAGDWVRTQWDANLLNDEDLTQAANLTYDVGDDIVNPGSEFFPEEGAHGTSDLRLKWLNFGISDGVPADCNTWNEPVEGIFTPGG
jgi:uncharacterized protein